MDLGLTGKVAIVSGGSYISGAAINMDAGLSGVV